MRFKSIYIFIISIFFVACASSGKKTASQGDTNNQVNERIYDIPPYMDFRGDRR